MKKQPRILPCSMQVLPQVQAIHYEEQECCPGHRWFEVALWRHPTSAWPEFFGCIEGGDAFTAITHLMRFSGVSRVAYAAAYACDRSLIYRAYKVWVPLPLVEEEEEDADAEVVERYSK